MGVLLTAGALSLVCLILGLPALRTATTRNYLGLGVAFVFALTTATDLRRIFPSIPRIPGHYNWTGKCLELTVSIVSVLLLIAFGKWKRKDFGLTFAFKQGTGRAVVRYLVPVLLAELIALWFMIPGQRPDFEDHLFQLTAPGISEELAFRGVLLALLDRAFPARKKVLGAELGWATVVTSIIFGLWHGLDIGPSMKVSLDIAPMVIPMLGGFVVAWCRARSGTLILPILIHSGMNEVANLIALVKAPSTATAKP